MSDTTGPTNIKSSSKSDEFFWRENFEEFSPEQVERYHRGVTKNPFNDMLYDPLIISLIGSIVDETKPLRILDAGGGTGKWAVYFARNGHQVTLLDVAEPMLEKARDVVKEAEVSHLVDIQQGTISKLQFDDNSFDIVFSDRNPISHAGGCAASYLAIQELARVLKQGGNFIASVLNKHRKAAQLVSELDLERTASFLLSGELKRSATDISYYYTRSELKTCLESAGLSVKTIHGTTIFAEWITTAWLLNEEIIEKLYNLERLAREEPELSNYGVRLHFVAQKN